MTSTPSMQIEPRRTGSDAGDGLHERALAGADHPDEGDPLARADRQVDVADDLERLVPGRRAAWTSSGSPPEQPRERPAAAARERDDAVAAERGR